MKKFLSVLVLASIFVMKSNAQSDDRKWRFGLRVTPQPTWFASGDKNNIPAGMKFGYGFGLNMERRFSDIVSLLTGIGGDFEGGKYSVKNDAAANYQVYYFRDESDDLVKPAGKLSEIKESDILCHLKERKVSSTFVTIPFILKLSTKELGGLKYYGMFGAEVGIRLKTTSTETYYETGKFVKDSLGNMNYTKLTDFYIKPTDETSVTGVNINKDAFVIPVRVGFNAGLGAEYRLSGTTAVFLNANFFYGLTPSMRPESKYMFYKTDVSGGEIKYSYVKQKLSQSAVRVSIGVMF